MNMEKEKKQEKEQRRQYERGKRRIRTAHKTGEFAAQKTLPTIGRVFIVGPRRLELLTFRV